MRLETPTVSEAAPIFLSSAYTDFSLEFVEMGGKGDQILFSEAGESRYADETMKAGAPQDEEE